jgi:hypothetical protein
MPESSKTKVALGCAGLALMLVAAALSNSSAATSAREANAILTTRGRVLIMAADGSRVAVATGQTKRGCGRVVVWTAPGGRSRSFKTYGGHLYGCGQEETRRYHVSQLALGGGQVAWIGVTGGNNVELHLEAAKLAGRSAKEIDFRSWSGDGRGEWVGRLLGGGPVLAYNRWGLVCDLECPPQKLRLVDSELVRISTGRGIVVKRGRGSRPLAAVGGGRMAVWSAGAVKVLAPNGSRIATVAAARGNPPRAIALSRSYLDIERMHTLDLYDPATGRKARSIPLGPAASFGLVGANSKLALLRGLHRMVLVRLSDGKRVAVPRPSARIVGAGLTTAGLFYAYNTRRTSARGRIVFEPTADLLARL